MTRFIFVTGGVISSLGKGIASASVGCFLKEMGYSVTIKKLDPYLNVDPGTMNPSQHGEVFVTEDGSETDLDLGHYERFLDLNMSMSNNITSGKIYQNLLEKERRGDYLGKTVQIIPHVTDLIKDFILFDSDQYDFVIIEVGGVVGDIEGKPFLEAIRQVVLNIGKKHSLFVHLTYIPYLDINGEIKTKPTQHSVRDLMYCGITPDILLCRTKVRIPDSDKNKLSLFCNVHKDSIIEAPDVDNIYQLPYIYAKQGLGNAIFSHFNVQNNQKLEEIFINKWKNYTKRLKNIENIVNIMIVEKYGSDSDAYKSLVESLYHAGNHEEVIIKIQWVNSKDIQYDHLSSYFDNIDGVIIPGGFGDSGIDGKISIIKYARENNIPLLGICLGMQLAVIEYLRNVVGISNANSTEFDSNITEIAIGLITEFTKDGNINIINKDHNLGGTMRLGSYSAILHQDSLAYRLYKQTNINERHRHRYEVNSKYIEIIEKHGGCFSGFSVDNQNLTEIFEIPSHKFFISSQFHPEFKSRPFSPHPLFVGLIQVAKKK